MRLTTKTLLATLGCLAVTMAPAYAANPWFASAVQTSLPNGAGPGPAPRGSTTADFNDDGKPDIVTITNFTQGNILLATGNGNGTVTPAGQITGSSGAQGLDAGDVNGDGRTDVVAATTSAMTVYYGNGAGGFTTGPSYPQTLGGQVEPRLLDLNGDGALDVAAPTFTGIQTLINNGNGTFAVGPTTQVPGTGAISAISPARLNNDTKADLFAVDGFSGTAFALKSTGGGNFAVSSGLYLSGAVPEDAAAIDLNGDGFDDLATIGSFSFSLTTALTNGQGSFTGVVGTTTYSGPGPTSLTAADLNGDGKKDLAISWLFSPNGGVRILAGNGTVSPTLIGDYTVGFVPQNPMVADFNGDGKPDIVTAGAGGVSFLRNITS